MANRKGHMKELLRGIVSDTTPTAEEKFTDVPQETVERLKITPEMEEALNRKREELSGRPKKGRPRSKDPNEIHATLILNKDDVRKMKYIALMETKMVKEVFSEAISYYVEMWESEHSKIKLPKKGE